MLSRPRIFATPSQVERSWHLLTVLIRLGRPACPAELASRSALDSIFLSPDLVEFLCWIPGSPISLNSDGLVSISEVAVAAFDQFLGQALSSFVPRVLSGVAEQCRDWSGLRLMYARKRKTRPLEAELVVPSAKRRLFSITEREEERRDDELRIQCPSAEALKVHIDFAGTLANSLSTGISSNVLMQGFASSPLVLNETKSPSSFDIKRDDHLRRDGECNNIGNDITEKLLGPQLHNDSKTMVLQQGLCNKTHALFLELFGCDDSLDLEQNAVISADTVGSPNMNGPAAQSCLLDKTIDKPVSWMKVLGEDGCTVPAASFAVRHDVSPPPFCLEVKDDINRPSMIRSLGDHVAHHNENKIAAGVDYCETEGTSTLIDASLRKEDISVLKVTTQAVTEPEIHAASSSAEPGTNLEQQRTSSDKPKVMANIASTVGFLRSVKELSTAANGNSRKQEGDRRADKGALVKQNMRCHIPNVASKEHKQDARSKMPKITSESKLLPNFESFVIEEEEGSGGYGTVYRARRKEDGKIFAIKRPHPNAHSRHVNNELKMLERFGGRNFVIKSEGSFKSGQSECFVLEHIEHDRPEVLKKEIDVFELQWYGYCMFRALASLHKHGIVHQDVKPGNFLFSRKLNKGYLIDFNLAIDLHQKFSKSSRSEDASNAKLDPFYVSPTRSTLNIQAENVRKDRILDSTHKEDANDSRKILLKSMKKGCGKSQTFINIDNSNKCGSQAADSGVTSAKDPTSTRTHSADRLKQPIPYKGRKELINFVQEAMQSPNHNEVPGPASYRKRVAAPLGKISSRLMIPTPMPLHSGGSAVAGAGMPNRGNKKQKKGPCVGTKGFRAPEVLFKSCHQGCKVDVWSAGVTLLYLIIGKAPFGGDPEQNIKEIAKLRGSEDLWEVAKLHNRESSYPADLFDVRFLRSVGLRNWCAMNTRRPEFLELVPQSLFDLLDKCLTVNPRRRISAEEALMHNFFAPCHTSLRKQRLLRRAADTEPESQSQ